MSKFVVLKDTKEALSTFCQRLSLFLADEKLSNEFQELLDSNQTKEILGKILERNEDVFNLPEKEIDLVWKSFCFFTRQQEDEDIIMEKLVSAITSSNVKGQSRLRVLSHLLSYYPLNSAKRFEIVFRTLSFALEVDQNDSDSSAYFSKTYEWVEKYNVSDQQKRKLYQVMVKMADKKAPGSLIGYKLLLKYLLTFENGENLLEAVSLAREAVVRSIKLVEIHHYDDLLEMKAIQQLEADPDSALLYKLVSHFSKDELGAFQDFITTNPQFLASFSLSEEDCLSKIRLLSLATLAARQPDLSYATVAKHLNISETEVEYWVVQAIVSGIVDGKIDQLNKKITISHATQRVFGPNQWEKLSNKLDQWHKTVQNIQHVLSSSSSRR